MFSAREVPLSFFLICFSTHVIAQPRSPKVTTPLEENVLSLLLHEAYEEGAFERVVDLTVDARPQEAAHLIAYRAAALHELGRYREAAEAFFQADRYLPGGFEDKTLLYVQGLTFFELRLYGRCQEIYDRLQRQFPRTRLAELGQQQALKIEERLARGVELSHLNWYHHEGIQAFGAGQVSLSVAFLEEALRLKERLEKDAGPWELEPSVHLTVGAAYLELGLADQAMSHLKGLSSASEGYRAGLFRAKAHVALGEISEARDLLLAVQAKASDPGVAQKATRLLNELPR
jgi:tetratricopeptide (TPR) repeat protein